MTNDFIFRKATTKDLKDTLRLNSELCKKEYREFDKTQNLDWTYGKEGRKFFREKIIKKNSFVWVAEKRRKVIGYLSGGMAKRIPWRKKAQYAYLGSIFIEKEFRERGLGAALVKNFIDWCKKKRVNYISVATLAKNKSAIDFYRHSGFRDYDLVLELKIG